MSATSASFQSRFQARFQGSLRSAYSAVSLSLKFGPLMMRKGFLSGSRFGSLDRLVLQQRPLATVRPIGECWWVGCRRPRPIFYRLIKEGPCALIILCFAHAVLSESRQRRPIILFLHQSLILSCLAPYCHDMYHITHHTSHITHYTLHITHHTSHITYHITCHTSHVTSYHITLNITLHHIISYHIMSCHVMSWYAMMCVDRLIVTKVCFGP
jgi:hypothetical protein